MKINLILILTVSTAFAEVRLIGVNEGSIELLRLNDIPKQVRQEIDGIAAKRKSGDHPLSHSKEVLLKSFGLSQKAKFISLNAGTDTKDVTITSVVLHHKNKGDCSNYPDQYLTFSYEPKQEGYYGFLLPEGSKVLALDSKTKEKYGKALRAYFMNSRLKDMVVGGQLSIDHFITLEFNKKVYLIMTGDGEDAMILESQGDKIEKAGTIDLKMCGA